MLQSKNLDVLHQGDSKSTAPQLHIRGERGVSTFDITSFWDWN